MYFRCRSDVNIRFRGPVVSFEGNVFVVEQGPRFRYAVTDAQGRPGEEIQKLLI